jgi:myosin heavy subunit
VSDKILLPPPTTANSIVTGANADLTNIFLQHLSIVAFTMSKGLEIVNVPLLPSPSPNAMSREDADQSDHISRSQHTWVDEIKLSWSDDGQSFSTVSQAVSTNLKDSTSIESINIENLNAGKRIKSIRIYPCKWETDNSCLRLAFHAYASVSISDCSSEGEYASSLTCVEILQLLRNATDILGVSADYIVKIEDMATVRKQEEAMKKMESIVGEKIAKEQALLDEKLALSSEKCSLEEQLKAAMSKLHEMEKTVVQEKSHRMQLEELRTSLDEDKKSLQVALQEQVEALSDAQTQLLKFHASAERDSKLVKSLQKRSENDHVTLSNLNAELSRVKDENNSLKKDCEDLLNQVEVLTDERDDARRNEEELFIALGERTYESEILQESYVTMSDRCNGYMVILRMSVFYIAGHATYKFHFFWM